MAIRLDLDESDPLNMTPMIDVVFNLLIFFLLSSTYLSEEQQLQMELPRVVEAAPLTDEPDELFVNVLADGRIRVADVEYDLTSLTTRLRDARANYPDQAVAIRGDGRVAYDKVAKVISVCKQVGISRLDILVLEE